MNEVLKVDQSVYTLSNFWTKFAKIGELFLLESGHTAK